MEQAIQKAGRSKYGQEHDIRAHIDRSTGAISLARYVEVVALPEDIENEFTQMDPNHKGEIAGITLICIISLILLANTAMLVVK